MSLENICVAGFIFVSVGIFYINRTLDKILDLYAKSRIVLAGEEPLRRKDIDDIIAKLSTLYNISKQMEKLLKIEEEKRFK